MNQQGLVDATRTERPQWSPECECEPAHKVESLLCLTCGRGSACYTPHLYACAQLIGESTWRGGGRIEEYELLYVCRDCGTSRRFGTVVKPAGKAGK